MQIDISKETQDSLCRDILRDCYLGLRDEINDLSSISSQEIKDYQVKDLEYDKEMIVCVEKVLRYITWTWDHEKWLESVK